MPEVKLTIDGYDYELIPKAKSMFDNNALYIFGDWYTIKQIKQKESTIPDKDWEILSFYYNAYRWAKTDGMYWNEFNQFQTSVPIDSNIQSVRRISDGVEFKIGDRICSKVNIPNSFTIEKIQIINDNFIYLDSCPLENAFHLGTEPKVPLFTTEDGVEIFKGDRYFGLDTSTFYFSEITNKNYDPILYRQSTHKFFSTEEKAKEYLLNNKPIEVNYKEIEDFLPENYNATKRAVKDFFKSKINL